ncbi:hypothetical protein AX16_003943 [Volvariella volvacea WC 439]|nr:hypothetical protein AX16_003943 [Volvariella volvacea WC 439]
MRDFFEFFHINRDPNQVLEVHKIFMVWLAISLVCDFIITAAMITLLWRAKNTITGALHGLLNQLILKSLETGAVTTVTVLIELVLFLKYPLSYLPSLAMYSVSRLYTMTLLASLNRREVLASSMEQQRSQTISTWPVTAEQPVTLMISESSKNSPSLDTAALSYQIRVKAHK